MEQVPSKNNIDQVERRVGRKDSHLDSKIKEISSNITNNNLLESLDKLIAERIKKNNEGRALRPKNGSYYLKKESSEQIISNNEILNPLEEEYNLVHQKKDVPTPVENTDIPIQRNSFKKETEPILEEQEAEKYPPFPQKGGDLEKIKEEVDSAESISELLDTVKNYSTIILDDGRTGYIGPIVRGDVIFTIVNEYRKEGGHSVGKIIPDFNIVGVPAFREKLRDLLILEERGNTSATTKTPSLQEELLRDRMFSVETSPTTEVKKIIPSSSKVIRKEQPSLVKRLKNFFGNKEGRKTIPSEKEYISPSSDTQKTPRGRNFFGRLLQKKESNNTTASTPFSKNTSHIEARLRSIVDGLDPLLEEGEASKNTGDTSFSKPVFSKNTTPVESQLRSIRNGLHSILNIEGKEDLEAIEGMKAVTAETHRQQESLKKILKPEGKKLLKFLESGANYLNKNVGSGPKLFACAGLIAAGALSAYASPVVFTAIGLTSLGMRVVSTAGTYALVKKLLDSKYETWEKEGKKISTLKKTSLELGAVITAAGAGQAVGWLFEHIATFADSALHTSHHIQDAHNEVASKITHIPVTPTDPTFVTEQLAPVTSSVEVLTQSSPELIHAVMKNENLWSIVRKTLSASNYIGFENFSSLPDNMKEAKIQWIVDQLAKNPQAHGITSGDVNKIFYEGTKKTIVDFTGLLKK